MSDDSSTDPADRPAPSGGAAARGATPSNDALGQSVHDAQLPEITESMLLVNRAQRGDDEALNDLLTRYEDRIRRIVRIKISARLRRVVESVDIVQDAFRNAFTHIGDLELRSTSSILQWLAKIAENAMLDTHRRHYNLKRDKTRELSLRGKHDESSGPMELPAGTPTPDKVASQQELAALVDAAVAELSDEYREVIMLRTYYGGSWEEVTEQMGRESSEATRQLHRRARIKLGKILKARMGGKAPDGGETPKNLD